MFSEQDVDRELKAALSVSPSPDFDARVLQRVEADRPSHWSSQYRWFAAAASVLIVAGVFYALPRRSVVVAPSPTPQNVEHRAPQPLAPRHEAPAHKNTSEPPQVEAGRASRSAPRTAEPDVIVPLNQMEAVRRLVRAVNEGRIEPPAEPLQGPMAPPVTLSVAPLVVEPIPLSPLGPGAETPTPFIRGLK
jgi:hypothetical protein